jgi:hypothetical protein
MSHSEKIRDALRDVENAGRVLAHTLERLDHVRELEEKDRCKTCDGRGVVPCPGYAGMNCRECKGRGYMEGHA